MIFLNLTDFEPYIKNNVLADICQTSYLLLQASGSTILDNAELISIEKVKSYLQNYYDIINELKLTGVNRSPLLISILIDIILYEINSRLTPTQIPENRKIRYEQVIKYLIDIQTGKTPGPWMILQVGVEPTSAIRMGNSSLPQSFYY